MTKTSRRANTVTGSTLDGIAIFSDQATGNLITLRGPAECGEDTLSP